jgi:DivIVA domain-containing protein
MTMAEEPADGRRLAQRLTPERVRATQFPRPPVGRRGYSTEAVDQFRRRVAEEITGRDAAEAALRAQVDRVRRALKLWQSEQLERRGGTTGQLPAIMADGSTDPAAVDQASVALPSVDEVNTLSQAQQQADAYIAQAQEYCRQITADARNRADAILCDAQERAEATAAQARRIHEASVEASVPTDATSGVNVDLDELDRRLTWARTFVDALLSVERQLTSSREALNVELDALDRMRQPAHLFTREQLAQTARGGPFPN